MTRTAPAWRDLLYRLGVKPDVAHFWAPVFAEVMVDGALSQGDAELDDFLGQVLHESDRLEELEENLYYKTPGRLMAVWPSRFKSKLDEEPYLCNPEKLAEKVYGGRMGNVKPGDGWRYRGSGLIQLTGSDNYRAVQKATGIPVHDQPEILRRIGPEALRVCLAWWEGHVPDAVMGDIVRVTKRVNGGTVGLADRKSLTDRARKELT